MEDKIKVRLGWYLTQSENACDIPVPSISQHTAIIAQSGSGKSFLLGRILEEYLLATKTNLVVIDTNGDFRDFNKVNNSVWKNANTNEWFNKGSILRRDEKFYFKEHWNKLSNKLAMIQKTEKKPNFPSINFEQLSEETQLALLGFDQPQKESERNFLSRMKEHLQASKISINLSELNKTNTKNGTIQSVVNEELSSIHIDPELANYKEKQKEIRNKIEDRLNTLGKIVQKSFRDIKKIIVLKESTNNVYDYIDSMMRGEKRGLIIDLPSLKESYSDKLIMVNAILEKLWECMLQEWEDALSKNDGEDDRKPIFIVMDEAHNFLNEHSNNYWIKKITDNVHRIVAEGRKYGLFIILSTQRPSKIPTSILAECENVCLLELNSTLEKEKVCNIWGVPRETVDQVSFFHNKGDCLLFGRWTTSIIAMHASPRRTKQGGKDLENKWQVPCDEHIDLFEEFDKIT